MPSPVRRSRALLAPLTVTAAVLAPVALVTSPAAAGDAVSVEVRSLGGGYSPYLFFGCSALATTVDDATPSDASAYAVTVGGRSTTTLFTENVAGGVAVVSTCPQDLEDGQAYDVVVAEGGAPAGAPATFTYEEVEAPTAATPPTSPVEPGTVTIPLTGTFEAGAEVLTKAVANRGGTRPEAVQAAASEIDLETSYDAAANAVTVVVPASAAGRFLWVSVTGSLPGQVTQGLQLAPVRVAGEAPYDASWVTGVGRPSGPPVVGSTVTLSRPRFSSPQAQAATTVRYAWTVGGRRTTATGRSLRITRTMVGKAVVAVVTFSADGTTPLVKSVRVGTARR